jgi:hypothetical protein
MALDKKPRPRPYPANRDPAGPTRTGDAARPATAESVSTVEPVLSATGTGPGSGSGSGSDRGNGSGDGSDRGDGSHAGNGSARPEPARDAATGIDFPPDRSADRAARAPAARIDGGSAGGTDRATAPRDGERGGSDGASEKVDPPGSARPLAWHHGDLDDAPTTPLPTNALESLATSKLPVLPGPSWERHGTELLASTPGGQYAAPRPSLAGPRPSWPSTGLGYGLPPFPGNNYEAPREPRRLSNRAMTWMLAGVALLAGGMIFWANRSTPSEQLPPIPADVNSVASAPQEPPPPVAEPPSTTTSSAPPPPPVALAPVRPTRRPLPPVRLTPRTTPPTTTSTKTSKTTSSSKRSSSSKNNRDSRTPGN